MMWQNLLSTADANLMYCSPFDLTDLPPEGLITVRRIRGKVFL
ncbi:MAG: hypothetical protein R2788_16120 [Saprospiraceae bacterium]